MSVDGTTNVNMKIPQLRTLYEKTGFNTTQQLNTAGNGLLHDGSVDSIERFIAEPAFDVQSVQDVADLTAFMLAFSGSELPQGSTTTLFEPPGTDSQDVPASVGVQSTIVDGSNISAAQQTQLNDMIARADAGQVGLVVKGVQGGMRRGYAYVNGGNLFLSDRAAETLTPAQLWSGAALNSELTVTIVPLGSETRIGIDRDLDGHYDRDELDAGTDPADPDSQPGGCTQGVPADPTGLAATTVGQSQIDLAWADNASTEDGYLVERAPSGSELWTTVANLAADAVSYSDTGVGCDESFTYRVSAFNCAGPTGYAFATGVTGSCCPGPTVNYCVSSANSAGAGAQIAATGSLSLSSNSFGLAVTGGVPGQSGMFFYGPVQQQVPFGDGTLCVGPGALGIARLLPLVTMDGNGDTHRVVDFAAPTLAGMQITAGSTWNFQFWYADPAAGGSGFNTSDALSATFCQ